MADSTTRCRPVTVKTDMLKPNTCEEIGCQANVRINGTRCRFLLHEHPAALPCVPELACYPNDVRSSFAVDLRNRRHCADRRFSVSPKRFDPARTFWRHCRESWPHNDERVWASQHEDLHH